jgi:hypothetical protein
LLVDGLSVDIIQIALNSVYLGRRAELFEQTFHGNFLLEGNGAPNFCRLV